MRWKLRIFGSAEGDREDTVDLSKRKAEAREALARSNRALHEARQQQPEVNRLAASLRQIRQANHFAEKIQATFRSTPL